MPSSHAEPGLTNGHDGSSHPSPPKKANQTKPKKQSGKSTNDEASRLLQARISQLEQDAAGEKDQELEIEREVKRANRDIAQQMAKFDNMQKIDYLTKRSSELLADMRRLERENQKNKRSRDNLQKERDNGRSELSKTVGLKEKLEKLCRELQRDNNKMKNENKELQTKQKHNTISWDEKYASLLSKLESYQEEKDTPKKQVVDMDMEELFRIRFKSFIDQYELRELHFHSLMRTKELEVQYHMARYEREKKSAESESSKARQLQSQVQAFTKTETELRNQLNVYVDKFKQVEDTLNNSNDLFLSFRKEMEDMSKKCKRLERENEGLRRQKDATNANILRMAEERQDYKKKAEATIRELSTARGIITAMQKQGRAIPPTLEAACFVDNQGGREGDEESEYSDVPDAGLSDYEEVDQHRKAATTSVTTTLVTTTAQTAPTTTTTYGPERPPSQQQSVNLQMARTTQIQRLAAARDAMQRELIRRGEPIERVMRAGLSKLKSGPKHDENQEPEPKEPGKENKPAGK